MVKNLSAMQETWVLSLGWEDLFEKGMATHSSILAWRIQWTEEPGGLQTMGLQRVGHDWVTKHSSASTISFLLITLQSTSLALISLPSFRVSPLKDTWFRIQHSCKQNSFFSLQKSFLIFWPWHHSFLHNFLEYVSYIHSFMWERDTCSVNLKERRVKYNLKGFFSSGLLRAFYMLMCIMKSPKWGLSIYCLQIYLIMGLFLEGALRKNQLHQNTHKILVIFDFPIVYLRYFLYLSS